MTFVDGNAIRFAVRSAVGTRFMGSTVLVTDASGPPISPYLSVDCTHLFYTNTLGRVVNLTH